MVVLPFVVEMFVPSPLLPATQSFNRVALEGIPGGTTKKQDARLEARDEAVLDGDNGPSKEGYADATNTGSNDRVAIAVEGDSIHSNEDIASVVLGEGSVGEDCERASRCMGGDG